MKKKIMSLALALVMCMTLCIPAWATTKEESQENISTQLENGSSYTYTEKHDGYTIVVSSEPPPGFDSKEFPPIRPNAEEDDCGHYCPIGYHFVGTYRGNTTFDMICIAAGVTVTGILTMPVACLGPASLAVDFTISTLTAIPNPPHSITGTYHVASYECNDPGIYPYIYWHHIWCYADYNNDGIDEYFCTAAYEYALLP